MQNKTPVVVVLGTGGTIAGTASSSSDNLGYTAAQLSAADLIRAIPALSAFNLDVEQVAQLDSKDMSFSVWRALALRCAHHLGRAEVEGIVITHGTDTLEETAWLLQRVLAPAKPVVLVAAMRPASSVAADGPQNLLDAVAVARTAGAVEFQPQAGPGRAGESAHARDVELRVICRDVIGGVHRVNHLRKRDQSQSQSYHGLRVTG